MLLKVLEHVLGTNLREKYLGVLDTKDFLKMLLEKPGIIKKRKKHGKSSESHPNNQALRKIISVVLSPK